MECGFLLDAPHRGASGGHQQSVYDLEIGNHIFDTLPVSDSFTSSKSRSPLVFKKKKKKKKYMECGCLLNSPH